MYRFLLCSFLLVLLYPTAIDLYLVGLPQIAADLNATESQLHVAFSVYLSGMAITMFFAGRIADSTGRKPVAIFGALTFIFASILGGGAEQSSVFLVARFIQGIGAGACYVVAYAILRDTLEDKIRAKVLSMLNGIICIIPVIAPVVGHLIMLKFPWPTLFTTMAVMGVIVAALSVFVLKETRPQTQKIGKVTHTANTVKKESLLNHYFLSRLAITSIAEIIILTYVNVSPMLLMGKLGMDRGAYSSVMALTALVGMLSSFSVPFALKFLSERILMVTAQFLFISAAILMVCTEILVMDYHWYLFGFGLLSAGFSTGFGVAMNQALSPFSFRAGVASSMLGISHVCCAAFYIWLMGLLNVNAFNMLVFILSVGSIVNLILILLTSKLVGSSRYEEIAGTP